MTDKHVKPPQSNTNCEKCNWADERKKEQPSFSKEIPFLNHIEQFWHCGLCLEEMPDDISPREWKNIEVGWTIWGVQAWCVRHEANIMHINFEGGKFPAEMDRKPTPLEIADKDAEFKEKMK